MWAGESMSMIVSSYETDSRLISRYAAIRIDAMVAQGSMLNAIFSHRAAFDLHITALQKRFNTNLNQSNQKPSIPFRPDIEGLRALAVGLVIASHAELPFLLGGFVGLDVFFVLSGYPITRLLMQEIASSGTVNFARFYARRARRLLPARDHDGF